MKRVTHKMIPMLQLTKGRLLSSRFRQLRLLSWKKSCSAMFLYYIIPMGIIIIALSSDRKEGRPKTGNIPLIYRDKNATFTNYNYRGWILWCDYRG